MWWLQGFSSAVVEVNVGKLLEGVPIPVVSEKNTPSISGDLLTAKIFCVLTKTLQTVLFIYLFSPRGVYSYLPFGDHS